MLQKRDPAPLLRSFVKEYWLLDLIKGSGVPLQMSPIPEQCLYFYPRSLPIPFDANGKPIAAYNNIIAGQTVSGGQKLLVPNHYCMFKILFQPGGFYRLFGTPMTLFADTTVETISVLGNPVNILRDQIANAEGFTGMVAAAETFLLNQLSKSKNDDLLPIDKVLRQSDFHLFTLDQLAADACLSTRQFERKFLERTGVSPKIYQRLIRFNQAMKLKNANTNLKWIDITYACGYFDPMHLLRDFKQFTGVTPRIFDFDNALIY
jgi:AraC-like DNA-binding protein